MILIKVGIRPVLCDELQYRRRPVKIMVFIFSQVSAAYVPKFFVVCCFLLLVARIFFSLL